MNIRKVSFVAKFLLISLCATLISTSFSLFVETRGVRVEADKVADFPSSGDSYTSQEADQLEIEANAIYEQLVKGDKSKPSELFYPETKRIAVYFSWIPWVFIPMLIAIPSFSLLCVFLAPPVFLGLFGVFTFLELCLFGVFLAAGWKIRKFRT